jgi:hypothetical protein
LATTATSWAQSTLVCANMVNTPTTPTTAIVKNAQLTSIAAPTRLKPELTAPTATTARPTRQPSTPTGLMMQLELPDRLITTSAKKATTVTTLRLQQ